MSNSVTLKLLCLKTLAHACADFRDTSRSEPYPPFNNKTCFLFLQFRRQNSEKGKYIYEYKENKIKLNYRDNE